MRRRASPFYRLRSTIASQSPRTGHASRCCGKYLHRLVLVLFQAKQCELRSPTAAIIPESSHPYLVFGFHLHRVAKAVGTWLRVDLGFKMGLTFSVLVRDHIKPHVFVHARAQDKLTFGSRFGSTSVFSSPTGFAATCNILVVLVVILPSLPEVYLPVLPQIHASDSDYYFARSAEDSGLIMAQPTHLAVRTPWWRSGWEELRGTPAFVGADGSVYNVEPPSTDQGTHDCSEQRVVL